MLWKPDSHGQENNGAQDDKTKYKQNQSPIHNDNYDLLPPNL